MATNYNIEIPLRKGTNGLFAFNDTIQDAIKQNIFMVIFTDLGSRINMPNYGTNIQKQRYEIKDLSLKMKIKTEILNAIKNWVQNVKVNSVQVFFSKDLPTSTGYPNVTITEEQIFVAIYYTILINSGQAQLQNQSLGVIIS